MSEPPGAPGFNFNSGLEILTQDSHPTKIAQLSHYPKTKKVYKMEAVLPTKKGCYEDYKTIYVSKSVSDGAPHKL